MPGLLQTQAEHFTKSKYVMALCAEFLGSCLFSFTGSALLSVALANPDDPNVVMAAIGNGAGIAIAGKVSTCLTMHLQFSLVLPRSVCNCGSLDMHSSLL